MSKEIKCPRAWDDVLGEMLYSKPEQFDDSLMFRFEKHFETENPVYMWPTGIHDRNGKEIYNGDILSWRNYNDVEFVGVVTEKPGVIYIDWKIPSEYPSYIFEAGTSKMEVIGNIHENPKLLITDPTESA